VRLNKFVSETGICSRREADAWISAGRVTVNGVRAVLGTQVEPGDDVRVDGQQVGSRSRGVYIALNKPAGVECTTDLRSPYNIVSFVNHEQRIFPIGRLDKESEGLILLTNDGDIVNDILRSENNHEKEYRVRVNRPITADFLQTMAQGVRILGQWTKPCRVSPLGARAFRIILTQGLNRQIRRMCEALGYEVEALQRVRVLNIELGNLPVGRWRNLNPAELEGLLASIARRPRER
jgi:23S rRNA pseudouridine2604 synthase